MFTLLIFFGVQVPVTVYLVRQVITATTSDPIQHPLYGVKLHAHFL